MNYREKEIYSLIKSKFSDYKELSKYYFVLIMMILIIQSDLIPLILEKRVSCELDLE